MRFFLVLVLSVSPACVAGTEALFGEGDGAVQRSDRSDTGTGIECEEASDCRPAVCGPACHCSCTQTCSAKGLCLPQCGCPLDTDAGVTRDSGFLAECSGFSDCAPLPLERACEVPSFTSCAFGSCVPDCERNRSCAIDSSDCVTCSGPEPRVACPACLGVPGLGGDTIVERSSCEVREGDRVSFENTTGCAFILKLGTTTGEMLPLDDGRFVGRIAEMRSPCLVQSSVNGAGALRTVWSCPGCAFSLLHF